MAYAIVYRAHLEMPLGMPSQYKQTTRSMRAFWACGDDCAEHEEYHTAAAA